MLVYIPEPWIRHGIGHYQNFTISGLRRQGVDPTEVPIFASEGGAKAEQAAAAALRHLPAGLLNTGASENHENLHGDTLGGSPRPRENHRKTIGKWRF